MLKVPKNQARNEMEGCFCLGVSAYCLGVFSTHENSTPKLKLTSFDRKVN